MGKGKKKDKGQKNEGEVVSVATLSLSDQPSTSSAPALAPDDDEGGLGLTGGGRKNKQKKQPGPSESKEATPEASKQIEPEVVSVPKPTPIEAQKRKDEDEDEGGIGLGLGVGKKPRNRKKNKAEKGVPAPGVAEPQPASIVQQTYVQPAPAAQYAPAPGREVHTAPTQQGQPRQQWGPPGSSFSQPSVPSGFGRGQGRGMSQPPGFSQPASQPSRYPQPASQPPGYPQPASQPSSYPQPASQPPGYRQPAPASQPPGYHQPTSQQHGTRKTPESNAPVCLYKIPDKVIGRPVPCRPVKIIVNYLEMNIKGIKLYRYDVIFKPERPKKFLPEAYKIAVKKHFNNVLMGFDQKKNVYCLQPLPGVPENDRLKCDVSVPDGQGKDCCFEVSFKFTGVVDLNTIISYMKNRGTSLNPPTEAIQAVDVILRQGALESYVKAGRQFFIRPSRPIDLGDGLEMWTGLFQSAIFTDRPYLNIDVAHKGFPKNQPLLDVYVNDFKLDVNKTLEEQRGRNVEAFIQFVKGLKFVASIGGNHQGIKRDFICNEILDSAVNARFNYNDGTISVLTYFEREKKVRVRYPRLNCLWVGPREKTIYYPMEFLHIAYGQVYNKQLNELQLSTLVKESATPPLDRKRKIEEVIKNMNYSNSPYFKKFGFEISNQFLNVNAKILQAPKLDVGGAPVEQRRGAWISKRLLRPQTLDSWGFIAVDTDPRNNLENVIKMIISTGNEMGMNVKSPSMTMFNCRITDLMRVLQTVKDKGIAFLFVVISTRGRDYYHRLKRTAEREVGVLTQCIKEFTATRKMNFQTAWNIMLKVNSKLMGVNHALDRNSVPACLQQGKVMLVGADVTHPSPDQTHVPSIAAVTASMDPKFCIYNMTLSIQTPKKEMIVDFEDMMVEHLNEFQKYQSQLPTKIYVFRDGVSEGQFAQVMNSELKAVHNAYKRKVGPMSNVRPEVLFLLVQKRHHTRFFQTGDSQYNVEPGTVVDTHIVHPKELDFYLVSHQAIKGTARPTRYHAVCNDGRISQDEVEQLAYYLCHLYARCTRSVSYPTPTYYAHLACMRARSLTFGDRFVNADLERAPQRLRVVEKILQSSKMFFV